MDEIRLPQHVVNRFERRWTAEFAQMVGERPSLPRKIHVLLLLEPTWLPGIAASVGRSHGRAAFRVRDASVLNQDVFMHLVVPFRDNSGRPFAAEKICRGPANSHRAVRRPDGFPRSPAQGTTTGGGETVHDEIVVFEVMTENAGRGWWRNHRIQLERPPRMKL